MGWEATDRVISLLKGPGDFSECQVDHKPAMYSLQTGESMQCTTSGEVWPAG